NLAQLRNVTLDVEGTLWITLSNSVPLARPIEINRPDTSAPADTERATLIQVVEQVLGNEISGSSEYTFTVVTNDANSMVFDVLITNHLSAGLTRIRRDYDLRFTYAPPP